MPIASKRRGRPSNADRAAALQIPVATPADVQPIEPQVPPVPVEPEAAIVPVVPQSATPDSVAPIRVMLGSAQGVLRLFPVGVVLGVLADTFGARLETLKSIASVLAQVDEVRDTEGRCAPIIFSKADGEQPALLAGIETLAAALVSGVENIAVIMVSQDDAVSVQSWVVGSRQNHPRMPRQQRQPSVFSVIE